jgi:hypothetical protein
MRYQTREVLLQNVLQHLKISGDVMLKPEVYGCISFYVVKAYLNICCNVVSSDYKYEQERLNCRLLLKE